MREPKGMGGYVSKQASNCLQEDESKDGTYSQPIHQEMKMRGGSGPKERWAYTSPPLKSIVLVILNSTPSQQR